MCYNKIVKRPTSQKGNTLTVQFMAQVGTTPCTTCAPPKATTLSREIIYYITHKGEQNYGKTADGNTYC